MFEQRVSELPHFEEYDSSIVMIVDTNNFVPSCNIVKETGKLYNILPDSIGRGVFYLDSIVEGVGYGDRFYGLYFTNSVDGRSFEYIALCYNDDIRFVGSHELDKPR